MIRICSAGEFREELAKRRVSYLDQHEPAVRQMIDAVRAQGDQAVIELTERFDGVRLSKEELMVSPEETRQAYAQTTDELLQSLTIAGVNIRRYHQRQLRNSWFQPADDGSILGQRFTPLQRVGLYVPGGIAAYPSSVLMNAIPAQVVGVPELVVCTPPRSDGSINPEVLVAADQLGINTIYKAGGAQAIAAMAFGTDTLPAVDKIVGPGNIFVTTAKRLVYGYVDIDMLAGPSEIMILADKNAEARLIAADLLSQAEHDALAQAILVTTDRYIAEAVQTELREQLSLLERKEQAEAALERYGCIVLVDDLTIGTEMINAFAPEHLELLIGDPWSLVGQIKHAGAIFLGAYSPEPMGDYVAGPSHVLPTGGTARFASGLAVDSFQKSSSVIALSRQGFGTLCKAAQTLANFEGLTAHANSVQVRCQPNAKRVEQSITQPGRFGGCFH